MKIQKYGIFLLLMMLCAVFLEGCHAMYVMRFHVTGSAAADTRLDLLIPLDETCPNYCEVSYKSRAAFSKNVTAPEKTPIGLYNEDGYRSMLVHYCLTDYRFSAGESDTVSEFCLDGTKEYREMCAKYMYFKIAEIDNCGNILYVSDEYKFMPDGDKIQVYLDRDILYDTDTHTPTFAYYYIQPAWIIFTEIFSILMMKIMPIACAVGLLMLILLRVLKHEPVPNGFSLIVSVVMWLPTPVYLLCRLDYFYRTRAPLITVWEEYIACGTGYVLYTLIPLFMLIGISIWAVIVDKKENRKK